MKKLSNSKVVGASLAESVIQVAINLVMALFTGSVAMLSQALQGLSDVVTTGLLFHGVRQARKKRDEHHPFGYGKAIFFWVLIAAIFMFFGTGLLSIYYGYQQLIDPGQLRYIYAALIILGVGFGTNLYATVLSIRRLGRTHGESKWWRRFLYSTMVETKVTLLIELLGTVAAVIGFISLGLYLATSYTGIDGIAGMVIGAVLMIGALLLIYDVKDLIVGRAVSEETAANITEAALSVTGVQRVLDLRTMYIGASKLLIVIEVHLRDDLDTDSIEAISDAIKSSVQARLPNTAIIHVEAETPDSELTGTSPQ